MKTWDKKEEILNSKTILLRFLKPRLFLNKNEVGQLIESVLENIWIKGRCEAIHEQHSKYV